MLRADGNYTIYKIVHFEPSGKWVDTNLDYFGTPTEAFSSSGECWQKTGFHGVLKFSEAEKALAIMRKKHSGYSFRLVEVAITQHSTML